MESLSAVLIFGYVDEICYILTVKIKPLATPSGSEICFSAFSK